MAAATTGLSEPEAARRLAARGKLPRERSSRSYRSIVRANTINIPNGILFVFGVLTIAFASWKDALFLGILISNIAIGSFQEIRSKRALDRLAALVAPEATVVRDGVDRGACRSTRSWPVTSSAWRRGDQVVADGTVVDADGLAVDESQPDRRVRAGRARAGERGVVGLVRRRGRRRSSRRPRSARIAARRR